MVDATTEGILLLAFGLGLLHALDADHIMAVSGLAAGKPGLKRSLAFCRNWATGHGVALLLIALAVYLFGLAIPERLSHFAESLVGLVLIAIGAWTLFDIARRRLGFGFHRHQGELHHAHWHPAGAPEKHQHSALLVGLLHGTAGSAPLLALLPMSQLGSPMLALAYVALFGFGVIVTMVVFGGLMGRCYQWLERFGAGVLQKVRLVVAGAAVALGANLLLAAA